MGWNRLGAWTLMIGGSLLLAGDPPARAPSASFERASISSACLIDDVGHRSGDCAGPVAGLLHRAATCRIQCPDGHMSERVDCDDPNVNPCGDGGGGGGGYYAPDPMQQRQQRYTALLERARRLVGNLATDAASVTVLNQRLIELDQRLEPVYAAAWQRWGQANTELAAFASAGKILESRSDSNYLDLIDNKQPEAARDRAQADALAQRRDAKLAALGKISAAADYYQAFARAQMSDIGRWINVVLPRSPEADRLRPQFLPYELRGQPVMTPVQPSIHSPKMWIAVPDAPTPRFDGPPPAQMEWPDDIDGRLTAVEARVTAANEALDRAAATEVQVQAARDRFKQYQDILTATNAKLAQADADDNQARDDSISAEHTLDQAQAGVNQQAAYLFSDAAKEFALEHFRKDVVEPELKRMVSAAYAGRPAHELTDEFVDASWSSNKLHLFKLVDAGETASEARKLVDQTLGFVDNAESAMVEAGRLLASADPAEAQAFADALSERLGSSAKQEAALALKTADIPQPYKIFWLKYFVGE